MVFVNLPIQRATGTTLNEPHDSIRYWGYSLLAASLALYSIAEHMDVKTENNEFVMFCGHYLIAIAYTVVLWYNESLGIFKSWRKENIHRTVTLLNLFLISAYALNREIPVFAQSTTWLCVFIFITSGGVISFAWYSKLPRSINALQLLVLGLSLLFYIYLTIACASYYGLGLLGIAVLAVGAHIFVPLFLTIAVISIIRQLCTRNRFVLVWTATGFGIGLVVIATFVAAWSSRIKAIERMDTLSVLQTESELPFWVRVAATLQNDWLTQKILRSNLTYRISDSDSWSFMPDKKSWSERRVHDPLVLIASHFKVSSMSREDRIRILEAISDGRHTAQERLWSGNHLSTADIVNDVDIYPDLRLSYNELYFSIRNDDRQSWAPQQEAIYTFQLPEGAVVTSLSLWINGKEEKAILTSKQKATTAYKTIVGVEFRDPSVVHWQEGNTVTVRVFPCTPDGRRKFKLGVTSPLTEENGRIYFKNVTFRGPSASSATELTRIRFISEPTDLDLPSDFTRNHKGEYILEDDYNPSMTISFGAGPIKSNHFTFGGFTYAMTASLPVHTTKAFSELYLDINNNWTRAELDSIRPWLSRFKILVEDEEVFVALTDKNWNEVTSILLKRNFSLFPFHRIRNADQTLVISKGEALSPFLADIKESKFALETSRYFSSSQRVCVFNLSTKASTYIRSLRELRAIDYATGSTDDLFGMLNTGVYPSLTENDNQVILHDAGITITKQPATAALDDNAPDHLARLFAYNNIMRQVGPHYFSDDIINETLVDEAVSAYVVSPVSSLIVLETQKDYNRFGIKDSRDSLHNASKLSAGAVPEPHEWALIAMFGIVAIYCIRQRWIQQRALCK